MHRTLKIALPILLTSLLVGAVTASAGGSATPQARTIAKLRAQVAKQKTTIRDLRDEQKRGASALAAAGRSNATLTTQLAKAKSDAATLASQLTTANGQIATLTTQAGQVGPLQALVSSQGASITALNSQLSAAQSALSGAVAQQIAAMNADGLWALMQPIFTRMPDQGICGYSPSFYQSGAYTSYTFTRYIC